MITSFYAYRAIRGGVWERENESKPWKRMRGPTGSAATDSENYEDHREAWPVIVIGAALLVLTIVASIMIGAQP